jgi:hypothetical protein
MGALSFGYSSGENKQTTFVMEGVMIGGRPWRPKKTWPKIWGAVALTVRQPSVDVGPNE